MMRIARGLTALFVYLCIGTVIAQAIGFGYAWSTGRLDADRATQIVAILHGVNVLALYQEVEDQREQVHPEQLSIDEVAHAKALASRDLELREKAIASQVSRIQFDQRQLSEDVAQYNRLKSAFDRELESIREGAIAEGRKNVRSILENVDAKVAKDHLVKMIDDGDTIEVVAMLTGMSIDIRAEIVSEFKTADEQQKIADVLRKIREGGAEVALMNEVQQNLSAGEAAGP